MQLKQATLLSLALCVGTEASAQNIVELADSTNRFNILLTALETTGLDTVLEGTTEFTVFAPTDFAFQTALGTAGINNLINNPELLEQILLYHVVPGTITAAEVVNEEYLTTVYDQRLDISLTGNTVWVDSSVIQYVDLFASNGVVHVIDAPLLPNTENLLDTAEAVGGFDTLVAAVEAAGLSGALSAPGSEFTVFAPTDAAFGDLPDGTVPRLLLPVNIPTLSQILQYHVVAGRFYADEVVQLDSLTTINGLTLDVTVNASGVFIDGSQIIATDVETANGNIHVIDAVLLP